MRLRFDFVDASGRPSPICFVNPARVIEARRPTDVLLAMREVDAALADGWYAAGFVSYEAAPGFDHALTTRPSASTLPLVWFGLFREPAAIDAGLQADASRVATPAGAEPGPANAPIGPWTSEISAERHASGVAAVRDAIARGDSYQANYTFRLTAPLLVTADGYDGERLYRSLARAHRAPYSAHLDIGDWRILSLSPELFFRLHDRRLTTRPMKGTATRGVHADEDLARAAWLAGSEKNRAENVMIVDLSRNDISRVAEVGSVRATSLFDVERYPTVFQMVSTVEGRLRSDASIGDVFTALFPAGSVTGAPKTSSMRLIAAIEESPRGVYCGAIGFATPAGDAVFNVAIRTMVIDVARGRAEYGIGGGITWDSTAGEEYREALSKAAVLTTPPVFDLLETMRLENGACVRRDRHLARLREAAAYFDRPYDEARIIADLEAHARIHARERRRVRLLMSADGAVRIESTPLADNDAPAPPAPLASARQAGSLAAPLGVVLARTPVSRSDRFLYHKTTHRQVYEAHRAANPGAFDVLLWNEARELTEFTFGNVVLEIDNARWTPPRASGLLAGVFRGELLDEGAIRERTLTIDDLARATRVWLINSVREWVEVRGTW